MIDNGRHTNSVQNGREVVVKDCLTTEGSMSRDKPFTPCEAFHPGEYIREEIEARGWSKSDLAAKSGLDLEYIDGLLAETKSITLLSAHRISQAFGTAPSTWLNLQSAYDRAASVAPTPQ